MAKYKFRFWFEWGCFDNHCPCLWSTDDITSEKFDYCVNIHKLPISDDLIQFLHELGDESDTAIDWHSSDDTCPWTDEQRKKFFEKTKKAHKMLQDELGEDYEILYDIKHSSYM